MNNLDLICKYCGKQCKNANSLRNHERLCKQNPEYGKIQYVCKYCGRKTVSSDGNTRHELLCKQNPNKCDYIKPWNRGLTKETNKTIAKCANELSKRIKNGEIVGNAGAKGLLNTSCKPEVRTKIANSMRGNTNNNPSKTGKGKKGWYKGFFCSSTYELAFVIYCIDHGIDLKRCKDFYEYIYDGKTRKYYPDFIINDTLIEIKGYYTPQVDAKIAAVIDRPIKVLYRKDLDKVFNYIFKKYDKVVDKNIHELYENMGD